MFLEQKVISFIQEPSFFKNLLATIALIICTLAVKFFINRNIDKSTSMVKVEKNLFKRKLSGYLNVVVAGIILVLWFNHLQNFFVSLIAIAAAVVLATKELIMCVTGGILIKINDYFKVGDRIEVTGIRGYVLEKSFTATRILEIGPEKTSQQTTGNILSLPNSIMLSNAVKNESYFKGFSIKAFTFPVPENCSLEEVEKKLLEWSAEYCTDYVEEARRSISSFCAREGLSIPAIDPRIKLVLGEDEKVDLLLKIPVKNNEVGEVEQCLLRKFMGYVSTQNSSAEISSTKTQ